MSMYKRSNRKRRGLLLLALVAMAAGSGCGLYSFSGSLPPHLKTVAIPLFDNRTAEFAIAEDITDSIIKEFNKDNSLKIADRNAADVLIEGSVISLEDRAGAFDPNEDVKDFKVYVTVQVKCTDQLKRLTMWEERVTQWGEYDPNGGPDARKDGITSAISKMSQEVLNKTVAAW